MTETAQRRSATHTISIVLSPGKTTSPTFCHLHIPLTRSGHRPWHLNLRVMDILGLSCHVLCNGLEETMWWHTAAKHVPVVSAHLQLRTQSDLFGSVTVPNQLENNPRAIFLDTDMSKRFPSNHKQNQKSRNAHCRTS